LSSSSAKTSPIENESTSHINPADVLDEILRQAQRLAPYTAANIALLEGERLRVARWHGYEKMGNEAAITNLNQSLEIFVLDREAILSRRPLVIANTLEEPAWVWVAEWAWIRSTVKIPLCLFDRVLGLLRLDSDQLYSFSAKDAQRLRPLANAAAIALENARLYEQAQQEVAERRRAEEEVRRLNADLERRVTERTAELAAANKELEAFSYSVSHDLRAPVRAINGFARMVLESHAPDLSPEAQRYLHLVRENALRMGQMIEGLLTFSRLGRQPLRKRPVSLTALVGEVLADLQDELADQQAEITLDDLPVTQGDPILLRQVFANLLSNAFKFTRGREVKRIHVGCQTWAQGEAIYFVKDNGAGFDMRYVDKLFGVFQRLHHADDFEGTGVGLALAQRIIERHGGRIWAEAEEGQGATFYFTLGGER
jgi:signal transduction histidine kinase